MSGEANLKGVISVPIRADGGGGYTCVTEKADTKDESCICTCPSGKKADCEKGIGWSQTCLSAYSACKASAVAQPVPKTSDGKGGFKCETKKHYGTSIWRFIP